MDMAVIYKSSMTKPELLDIAITNGIAADDSMTKAEIIAALDAFNNVENTAESAAEGAESDDGEAGTDSTTPAENTAESAQEEPEGYDLFAYAGPSLPYGRLKENAVFRGTREDVKAYLADVLEKYPQIDKLIIPVSKLAAFSVKVKTPGNIAHKYYNDIVSAMRSKHKEV